MTIPTSPDTQDLPPAVTKTQRAFGYNLADYTPLLPAENTLRDCCAKGEFAVIGDSLPADAPDPNTVVRASFLRFLLLGGDEQAPVHEHGVQLRGAVIQEPLELFGCHIAYSLALCNCRFNESINVLNSEIAGFFVLSGSHLLAGLCADGLRCKRSVFLRDAFRSAGEVRLYGAHIGGDLDCSGGQFEPTDGVALSASFIVVNGLVRLSGRFKATGTVNLLDA